MRSWADQFLPLLDVLEVGVVSLDAAGTLLSANDAARRLLNASAVGEPLENTGVLREDAQVWVASLRCGMPPLRSRVRVVTDDGTRNVDVTTLCAVDGATAPFLGVLQPERAERAAESGEFKTSGHWGPRQGTLRSAPSDALEEQESPRADGRLLAADDAIELLVESGRVLNSSIDYEATLPNVARLCVPRLSDWCSLDVIQADGTTKQLAIVHADPAKVRLARELRDRYPPDKGRPDGIQGVLKSGRCELVARITDDMLRLAAHDDAHLRILRSLALHSAMVVPLRHGDQIFGAMTLASAESRRTYSEKDLVLLEEIASRSALAVLTARLQEDRSRSDQRRDDFVSMLGHELRNPLAPMMTAVELIRLRSSGIVGLSRPTEVLGRQIRHLTRLVDELLDVSRMMRGRIRLFPERVRLSDVLGRALESTQHLFSARQHRISIEGPEDLHVFGDAARLEQIFGNLLTNAAKFTCPGDHVSVSYWEDSGKATVRIRDTGVGIRPTDLPHVFEPFVQPERAHDRSQSGLGLGLTLVKHLAALHGGSVQAFSEGPGTGAAFVVTIPLEPTGTSIPEEPDGRPSGGPPLDVMIVDDNVDAAEGLAELVELFGHKARVEHDGERAIATAIRNPPDLVLLDIGLPRMNGFEVVRLLKERRELSRTRFIAVTGYGGAQDRKRSLEAGFHEHLVKPIETTRLKDLLRRK